MASLKELGITGVIDCHSHSGGIDHYNFFAGSLPIAQSVDDLAFKARLSGVSEVITFPFPSTSYYNTRRMVAENVRCVSGLQDHPYQLENAALIKGCEKVDFPVLPFMAIDPSTAIRKQVDDLRKIYDHKKFYGFKLHTLATGVTAKELIDSEFVEFAREKDIPILIHSGLCDGLSSPSNIVQVAKACPDLRLCIAHLAWLDAGTIVEVTRLENLFIDTCPFLQICNAVRDKRNLVAKPNLIDPDKPAESMYRYYQLLKDSMIWGTDEPWTKCINSDGGVVSNHNYADEANVIAELFKLSPQAAVDITSVNTRRFLFDQ